MRRQRLPIDHLLRNEPFFNNEIVLHSKTTRGARNLEIAYHIAAIRERRQWRDRLSARRTPARLGPTWPDLARFRNQVCPWDLLSSRFISSAIPRIQDLHAGRLEIGKVAGNNGHSMSQSGRRDERVSDRPRIGDMQSGATTRDRRVDR